MDAPYTIPFETFWTWLQTHPNCILRAGTPEAVLYDDEDLHWHLAQESPQTLLVQVLRGKRLVGEMVIDPEQISHVQAIAPERRDEHVFELMVENESNRFAAYFFTLIHEFEDEDSGFTPGRVH